MSTESTYIATLKEKIISLKDKFLAADNQMKTRMVLSVLSVLFGFYFFFIILSSGIFFLIKLVAFAGCGWLFYTYCLPLIKESIVYIKAPVETPVVTEDEQKQ